VGKEGEGEEGGSAAAMNKRMKKKKELEKNLKVIVFAHFPDQLGLDEAP